MAAAGDFDGAVIVAMVAVRMMEMAADQIIHVIAVRNRQVAAIGAVLMAAFMPAAAVAGCASLRIPIADAEAVLLDVIAAQVMQVTVVKIIDVTVVPDGGVSAIGPVDVGVALVRWMFWRHTRRTRPRAADFNLTVTCFASKIPYHSPPRREKR